MLAFLNKQRIMLIFAAAIQSYSRLRMVKKLRRSNIESWGFLLCFSVPKSRKKSFVALPASSRVVDKVMLRRFSASWIYLSRFFKESLLFQKVWKMYTSDIWHEGFLRLAIILWSLREYFFQRPFIVVMNCLIQGSIKQWWRRRTIPVQGCNYPCAGGWA